MTSQALLTELSDTDWRSLNSELLILNQTQYLSSITNLASNDEVAIIAVLQKSLDKELIPFYQLQWKLLAIAVSSLFLAFIQWTFFLIYLIQINILSSGSV